MSDRKVMPGDMPTERAERDSDESRGFHVERQLERAREMREAQLEVAARDLLTDREWWSTYMEGLANCEAVATCLARCFGELDSAAKGQKIATTAIITALHNLERDALADAREEL